MNDSLGFRTLNAIGVYVGHDIVADNSLPLFCHIVIDIFRVRF